MIYYVYFAVSVNSEFQSSSRNGTYFLLLRFIFISNRIIFWRNKNDWPRWQMGCHFPGLYVYWIGMLFFLIFNVIFLVLTRQILLLFACINDPDVALSFLRLCYYLFSCFHIRLFLWYSRESIGFIGWLTRFRASALARSAALFCAR